MVELITREEFKSLPLEKKAEYYNLLRDKGISVSQIYKGLGISRSRAKEDFIKAGYILNDKDKKYYIATEGPKNEATKIIKVDKIDEKVKDEAMILEELKNLRHIYMVQQKRLSELEKRIDGINYVKYSRADINYKIEDEKVIPKSFRIYESVLNRLDEFKSKCEKVKMQDIISNAIICYIEKIENEK